MLGTHDFRTSRHLYHINPRYTLYARLRLSSDFSATTSPTMQTPIVRETGLAEISPEWAAVSLGVFPRAVPHLDSLKRTSSLRNSSPFHLCSAPPRNFATSSSRGMIVLLLGFRSNRSTYPATKALPTESASTPRTTILEVCLS